MIDRALAITVDFASDEIECQIAHSEITKQELLEAAGFATQNLARYFAEFARITPADALVRLMESAASDFHEVNDWKTYQVPGSLKHPGTDAY